MKKLSAVICSVLVAVLAFGMVACSSYSKVEKAFKDAGYEDASETAQSILEELLDVEETIQKDAEEKDTAIEFHLLYKLADLNAVLILEFKATEDLKNYYEESETFQNIVKGVSEDEDVKSWYKAMVDEGFANGNCVVIGTNVNKTTEIVKSI